MLAIDSPATTIALVGAMKKIRLLILTTVGVLAFVDPAAAGAVQKLGPPIQTNFVAVPESAGTFLLLVIALIGLAAWRCTLAKVNSRP